MHVIYAAKNYNSGSSILRMVGSSESGLPPGKQTRAAVTLLDTSKSTIILALGAASLWMDHVGSFNTHPSRREPLY